jgi:excinuclease ABC subunit B
MDEAIAETARRRSIQDAYNKKHGISPVTVQKAVADILSRRVEKRKEAAGADIEILKSSYNILIPAERKKLISALNFEMLEHAKNLEFEEAAALRDEISLLTGKAGGGDAPFGESPK